MITDKPIKPTREFRLLTESDLIELSHAMKLLREWDDFFPDDRDNMLQAFQFVYMAIKCGGHPTSALTAWGSFKRSFALDSETE